MIIRPASPQDAEAMVTLQNEIIRIGGTTAYQTPRAAVDMLRYIAGASVVSCHLADEDGLILGFQSISRSTSLPEDWGDIGTFVQPGLQAKGIGGALFAASLASARAAGLQVLNATIRADNVPGLAYYGKRGFVEYESQPDWVLADGRKVGRVSRRFDL